MSALIGIFGGTFNPIHLGHLSLAREVSDALNLSQIRFVPSANPPHKPSPIVSAQQRAEMVQLAIQAYPNFVLDTQELARTGASYTVDTLEQLSTQFPDDALCLMMGEDAFSKLNTWHQWQRLFGLAHIALVQRPNQPLNHLPTELENELKQRRIPLANAKQAMRSKRAGLICQIPITPVAISSTEIRLQISRGQAPKECKVPPAVIDYIMQNKLYQT